MEENQQKPWKGYSIDELRMLRIVNVTKIELEKARLSHLTEQYTNKKGKLTPFPLVNKIVGALDFFDYGLVAYKLGRSIFTLLRRKK